MRAPITLFAAGTQVALPDEVMNEDRIDFISAYCDTWCDRCAYTSRCSAFATEVAIAMCGDVRDGIELAVGRPHPEKPDAAPIGREDWLEDLENSELTAEEQAEFDRREKERDARVRGTPIANRARAYARLSRHWLTPRADTVLAGGDDVFREALAIVRYDALLIDAKLHRALTGRDRHTCDGAGEEHPVQNDWNGSAKVALISLERSAAAWDVIAAATGEGVPATLADVLRGLRREVEEAFPRAWSFVRPGFDEPGR